MWPTRLPLERLTFRQRITHAGYKRAILKRNPRRYDEDGDGLDDEEIDEQADSDAAALNPYSHIRLEGPSSMCHVSCA